MIVAIEGKMDSIEKVKALIKEKGLLYEESNVVVGVSGGADSVCLLFLLKDIIKPGGIIAVHINHGIRGEEAARDEEFVKKLCEKYNIELEIRHLDVPAYAKENKISEEEAGRVLRYKIFEEIRKDKNADKIAVAHNMNDVAETFLMNLSRGSGITGLTGIKSEKGEIIRPLIKTNRAEIEEIVKYYGESYITDSTNNSLIYSRNRIRNKVLPELTEVNEQAVRHINEAAGKLSRIENFILKESEKAYEKYVSHEEDIYISSEIMKIDEIIIEEVIHKALTEAAGKTRDISEIHINYVKELFKKQTGRKIDLPYSVKAYREYDRVRLTKEKERDIEYDKDLTIPELKLTTVEINEISDIFIEKNKIELKLNDGSIKNLTQNSCIKWFDYDKISENVILRYRKDGDYLVISENGDRKKLKKYFIDSKIPLEKRDSIPVVASGGEILWIVGLRTGEGAKITKATRKLLRMEII